MKALLHVHSTYSYDGTATLAQLAAWGAARGLDLILMSEHVNDFDVAKMERYLGEIEALGDTPCRLVPGLEFAVRGGFHLLGFNVRRWMAVVDPLEAVRFIRDQGGLAVLAHPSRYAGRWPEAEVLRTLHGIEAWNARYDGRFLPSGDLLGVAAATAARAGELSLFGGQDLHAISGNRLVVTRVASDDGLDGFLEGLRAGRATFGARGIRIAARTGPSPLVRGVLTYGHRSYRWARGVRNRWRG